MSLYGFHRGQRVVVTQILDDDPDQIPLPWVRPGLIGTITTMTPDTLFPIYVKFNLIENRLTREEVSHSYTEPGYAEMAFAPTEITPFQTTPTHRKEL